jgi:hypothetical protein
MDDLASESEWQRKGATLSDKTARKEFGAHAGRSPIDSELAVSGHED